MTEDRAQELAVALLYREAQWLRRYGAMTQSAHHARAAAVVDDLRAKRRLQCPEQ